MHKGRVSLIVALLLLATLVGGLGWMVYASERQERLNRALIAAIKHNDTKSALAALTEGADPNAMDEPPQHLSLWRLLLDRLRGKRLAPSHAPTALLVALGAPSDHVSNLAQWQIPPENIALIQALLDRGADVNARLQTGDTPLLLVIKETSVLILKGTIHWGRDHTIKLLLEHGANVNTPDIQGITPFCMATIGGKPQSKEILTAMIDRGADINARMFGYTPLMETVLEHGPPYIVELLLQHHADLNIKSPEGKTVLTLAREEPADEQIIQMLKRAGAKE